jgi:hypothetical protein
VLLPELSKSTSESSKSDISQQNKISIQIFAVAARTLKIWRGLQDFMASNGFARQFLIKSTCFDCYVVQKSEISQNYFLLKIPAAL